MKNQSILLLLITGLFFANACSSESPEPKKEDPTQQQPEEKQEDIPAIDDQVTSFLQKYGIPGASLAISKGGKLVYKKAFGVANKETNVPVTVDSRFRLASLSKTYTGVAIMKLVQDGKFKLDDTVFGEKALLGTTFGSKAYPENFKKVTVRQLLQMTSGGFLTESNRDAIDSQQGLDNNAFFNWMMDNSKLAFEPGTNYRYVNTNFFIAGRIIEKFSGKSFINYVKEDLLKPLGDTSTELAKRSKAGAYPNEVTYYGQGGLVGYEYGFNIERRDADGGIVTTATDVLRFVNAIDGFPSRPDILNTNSLNLLTTPSTANNSYACGIGLWGDIWYNYGTLPGTRTGFMRHKNGMAVVLLLNSTKDYFKSEEFDPFVFAMQDVMVDIVSKNTRPYKDIDQF